MLAEEEDWDDYLEMRRRQGFAAVQFVSLRFERLQPASEG